MFRVFGQIEHVKYPGHRRVLAGDEEIRPQEIDVAGNSRRPVTDVRSIHVPQVPLQRLELRDQFGIGRVRQPCCDFLERRFVTTVHQSFGDDAPSGQRCVTKGRLALADDPGVAVRNVTKLCRDQVQHMLPVREPVMTEVFFPQQIVQHSDAEFGLRRFVIECNRLGMGPDERWNAGRRSGSTHGRTRRRHDILPPVTEIDSIHAG